MSSSDLTPGSWEFSTVRKGYDPSEVRAYIGRLETALAEARDAGGAPGAPAGSSAEADAIVDAARQQAAQILADARTAAGQLVPGGHAGDAAAGVNRWDSLGENIARVLRQAESEAEAIRTSATNEAQATRMEAEHVRGAAEGEADATRAKAAAALADAEQRAREIVAVSEERADQEAATVVARAEAALAPRREALDKARAELEDLHERIGSAMARAIEPLGADAVDDAVATAAAQTSAAPAVAPTSEPESAPRVVDWTGGAAASSAAAAPDPAPADDDAPAAEPEAEPEPEPAPTTAFHAGAAPTPAPPARDSWSETGLPRPAAGAPWASVDGGTEAEPTGPGNDFWPAPPKE